MEGGENGARAAATIVVVEDDDRVRELIRAALEGQSYRVLEASDGATLFALLAEHETDLVTLDIGLGGESGLDLVREIRRSHELGIVMVTARGELIDTVVGLELGADDYIVKPFELRELIARVRSVLRRCAGAGAGATPAKRQAAGAEARAQLVFGPWRLEPVARRLRDELGEPCALTSSEFDLLLLFAESPHRVLSRDEIMISLKGRDWRPTDRVVDNLVAQLRRKLSHGNGATMIDTVRGKGYRFSADVRQRR